MKRRKPNEQERQALSRLTGFGRIVKSRVRPQRFAVLDHERGESHISLDLLEALHRAHWVRYAGTAGGRVYLITDAGREALKA